MKLGDVVELKRGKTYKSALLGESGVPLLGLATIEREGGFRSGNFKRYPGDSDPSLLVKSGELYASLKDVTQNAHLLGSVARLPAEIYEGRLTQDTVLLRIKDLSLDTSFLYWVLRAPQTRAYFKSFATGTTNLGLSREDFLSLELPKATPANLKLSETLDNIEKLIELNRKTNETLEEMAKALFKSWFVDFDPVRAKAEGRSTGLPDEISDLFPDSFEDSELGEIPSGWRVEAVGDVIESVGGSTPSTSESEYWDGGEYFWATPKDLSSLSEPFILDTAKKITEAGVQRISSGVLPAGTVLLSSRAPVGYIAVATVPLSINQGFIALKSNDQASSAYLLNWCLSNVQQFKDRASGTTFPEISKAAFRPIPFLVPSEQIMTVFSTKAKVLYDRVVLNMRQSDYLAKSRDALLPKLISGEIRIPDAEKLVSDLPR